MTLGLYFLRRLALAFGLITLGFWGMLLLFEIIESLRRFGGHDITLVEVVWLSMLAVMSILYEIMPFLVLLAAMTMVMGLARSSELVVARAAGRSAMRMLREPFVAMMVFGLVLVAGFNPLVAAASRHYQDRIAALQFPDQQTQISLQGAAVWMRQGDALGQTVIRAQRIEGEGLSFAEVGFLLFERDSGRPLVRLEAERARLEPGVWHLSGVKRWDLAADNPEREAIVFETLELPSDLTGERLRESLVRAGTLSVWDLPAFIDALDRAGLSSRSHRARFMSEMMLPVLMGAMLLVGSVLSFRHVRAGGMGIRVLITVLAGFALFFVRNFALVLGENGQIPLPLAIWTPPVASMLLALGVLLHLEDG